MHPADLPAAAEEKAEYDRHQNRPEDAGYRRFVAPLYESVRARLNPGAIGLDFGCGAGSALMELFREAGYEVCGYDPFYEARADRLERRYDFVVCSEAAEHFHRPAEAFKQMLGALKSGGVLGIMTAFRVSERPFESWHYVRDRTHTAFYSPRTFAFLAQRFDLAPPQLGRNLALFSAP